MIHRTGSFAEIQHRSQCAGNICLGTFHRGVEIIALRQIGCNRAGQGTARPMGVGIVDAFSVKPTVSAVPV